MSCSAEEEAEGGRRPLGLDAVHAACRALYPDQPNPLQVTALVKHWLGGPDPLDYISMFAHPGNSREGIPLHWHYISLGLSDLHGDGRVHSRSVPGEPSGFGFELTFRLRREKGEKSPPTWPAELMQVLTRYVFQSENVLCEGDHISWHSPLDRGESHICHMLLSSDPQLPRLSTPLGYVDFVQIVGVTAPELEAAQRWNGPGVLDLLRKHPITGGRWLVTDMRRVESLFDIDVSMQGCVEEGVRREGSNLSGVSAVCSWEDREGRPGSGLILPEAPSSSLPGPVEAELLRTTTLDSAHLRLNLEAANLLPLAIRGRLKHGRHFTYKSFTGEVAITLVCPGVQGAFADERHVFAAHGPWLQVFVQEDLADQLLAGLEPLLLSDRFSLPHTMEWPHHNLTLTILPND